MKPSAALAATLDRAVAAAAASAPSFAPPAGADASAEARRATLAAFFRAVSTHDVPMVARLLEAKTVAVEEKDTSATYEVVANESDFGLTALHWAARRGCLSVARYLVEVAGADLNATYAARARTAQERIDMGGHWSELACCACARAFSARR